MKSFKDIKVGTKLVTLVAFMGVLMLVSVFLTVNVVENINSSYQRIQKYDTEGALWAVQAGKSFSEDRGSLTRWLFRVDPAERQQIAAEMAAQDKKVDEAVAAVQEVSESDAAKTTMQDVHQKLQAYRTARAALMAAQTQPGAPVDNLAGAQARA